MTDELPSHRVGHVPVLLDAVVAAMAPRDGASFVDMTFGAGGYSRAILAAAATRVWAIDRDRTTHAYAQALMAEFGDRLTWIEGRFGDARRLLAGHGVDAVDGGVMFDLGVSSMQIDEKARGFSFRHDGPLDMRMGDAGLSAAEVVNSYEERELAHILRRLGEERRARRVAGAIVRARQKRPFARTAELADVVRAAVPRAADGIDPATRTFQALRIHVNDELGELGRGLTAAEQLLRPGGRLAVVSFHSLEDGAVKRFLRVRSDASARPSRHMPAPAVTRPPSFQLLNRRPIRPSAEEVRRNPRARSAKLRGAERTGAGPWSDSGTSEGGRS